MTINNNNIFGAFTLGEVRSGRLTGDWLNKESVANYGWFGGGGVTASHPGTPGTVSVVDRIDFSNDTITALSRGNILVGSRPGQASGRRSAAAAGNSNYGWFGGGTTAQTNFGIPAPSVTTYTESSIERIDYSNDSSTASIRGPLSLARFGFAATGNSNYGWFGGGAPAPGPANVATVDRIDFSNDSSTASFRGPLSSARYSMKATGNSNYGWFGGGRAGSPIANTSTVDRIDFSNDSPLALARGPLSSARYGMGATGNSNYGWFAGGGSSPIVSTVDRIDFSNDSTSASVRGSLVAIRYGGLGATANSNYGWFGGGFAPGATRTATVNRVDFSNDTATSSPRGSLSLARTSVSATSGVLNIRRQKAGNFGWFGGGSPGPVATVERIDFSNDSSTTSPRGPLSSARYSLAATGNSNYGWFGGGGFPTTARVDRIDFSNDSSTTSPRGPLSSARYRLAATGNSNYGWFGGGGFPLTATVDRVDFSNDSSTASVRGPLSSTKRSLAATGNSNYGWFGGGSGPTATVDRIDFSNDSTTASVRGPLSSARYYLAATGNSNYGWFGGGGFPSTNRVDRIDFSNDSSIASVRGPLLSGRLQLAATGNSNYGWFGGGYSPGVGPVARVDRIDFSNDSSTASVRGPLSLARYDLAATSNTSR
jgi:hypothetical protein